MIQDKPLLGKIVISGMLKCITGLHIGASKENMEIGAIDAPVVRDPVTREPYVPGSSLKGKLRTLLEKALSSELGIVGETKRRNIGTDKNKIWIHVCGSDHEAFQCKLCRIFGSTGKDGGNNFPARLIVRDAYLKETSVAKLSEIDTGLQYTEWKFENAIDRVTSAANPRQIERVPKGAEFDFEMIYNVEDNSHLEDDLKNVKLALDILQIDALGGHGSRGYGKVEIGYNCIRAINIEGLKSGVEGKTDQVESLDDLTNLVALFKNSSQSEQK